MTVAGRVLDPDGKPMAGVPVDVLGRPATTWPAAGENVVEFIILGRGVPGPDGRFQLDAARTRAARFSEVYVLAAAPGYGLNWAALNPGAEQPTAEIQLLREQLIRGRLVDLTGQPGPESTCASWTSVVPGRAGRSTACGFGELLSTGSAPGPRPFGPTNTAASRFLVSAKTPRSTLMCETRGTPSPVSISMPMIALAHEKSP